MSIVSGRDAESGSRRPAQHWMRRPVRRTAHRARPVPPPEVRCTGVSPVGSCRHPRGRPAATSSAASLARRESRSGSATRYLAKPTPASGGTARLVITAVAHAETRRSSAHGGNLCQESAGNWPGDLLCRRAGGDCIAGFPRRCRVSCRRAAVGQAGAPAAVAPVRARARTNELDAGERRPMIGGGEQPASRFMVAWAGFAWGGSPELCGLAEWISQPPIRPPGRAGAMTMSSGARAAQSVRRARRGRLRMIYELARARRPFRACHGAAVWGVAGGGAAGCSASVSRCARRG
jgi:hypothetical protein